MDRVPLSGPLALLGCSAIVVGLVYLALGSLGLAGRLRSALRYLPAIPSSSLPAPANASGTSLSASLSRTVKTAKSTVKNATHLSVPKALGSRWSQIIAFFARRRRKRIMLEELPTTSSPTEDPMPQTPEAEPPVLVDLTETSNVSSPSIPLRRLGAVSPPLRSPTPLLASVSNLLATPPLTAASSSALSRDSPPPPSTPPPYRGIRHSFVPVSPFSSPPFKAAQGKPADLQDLYPVMRQSAGVIYPHSRPRTPSPISHNPYFLSTSPIPTSPLRYHRRTRSLGGINARRILTPSLPMDVFNECSSRLELRNLASHRRLTSRSTELLIDLENGGETEASLSNAGLVEAGGNFDDFDDRLSGGASDSEDLEALTSSHLFSKSFPLSQDHDANGRSITELEEAEVPSARVEFPKIVSNNAWREWDDDEKSLLSLNLDGTPPLEPILPIPATALDLLVSSQDPFGDFSVSNMDQDLFENPFDDPDGRDPFSPIPAPLFSTQEAPVQVAADSLVQDLELRGGDLEMVLDDALVGEAADWGGCGLEVEEEEEEEDAEEDEEEEEEAEPEGRGWEQGIEDEKDAEVMEEVILPIHSDTVHCSEEPIFAGATGDIFSSHMPTPPASPPFPSLRAPSEEGSPLVSASASQSDTEELTPDLCAEGAERPCEGNLLGCSMDNLFETSDSKPLDDRATEACAPADDPPLPEIVSQNTEASESGYLPTPVLQTSAFVLASNEDSRIEDGFHAPVVEEGGVCPADETQDPPEPSLGPSPDSERSRPAWSIRAAEAPRLGMASEGPKELATDEDYQEKDGADDAQCLDQIPGAFPESDQINQIRQRKPVSLISKDESKQARPTPVRAPAIDTSSFAAAILSLRRKPEPLDVALAMQMRPGLGAGADPAWMVRFMMSVFGWLAVAMSAGID